MTNRLFVHSAMLIAAVTIVASTAHTQTVPVASAPAVCVKQLNERQAAQVAPALAEYRAATTTNRAALAQKYQAAYSAAIRDRRQAAVTCAAQFDVATIPSMQLTDLVKLLNLAFDTVGIRRATDRLLGDITLPPRMRGEALLLAMNQAIANDTSFAILPGAERFVAQIDVLADSLSDIKLSAHRTMLGRYEYLDVAEGLFRHATALIALARKSHDVPSLQLGYTALARSFADRLNPDSALKILDAGEREIGATAVTMFTDFRTRYHLIGTLAPVIDAKWWINTDEKAPTTPMRGRVTLIEFTAHWCGPCKNSYPGLRALAEQFKGKAFGGVMVTQLYGYLGAQKNLSALQEVEADKAYFGTEHKLPFPVAINAATVQSGDGFVQPKADTDYRVGGIPQIMLVDKHGVIRQIVTGWDQGNTERFSKYIEQLLREP